MRRKSLPFIGRLLLLATLVFPFSCQDDLTDEVESNASNKNDKVFISFEEAQKIASSIDGASNARLTDGTSNARSGIRIQKSRVFKDRKNRDAFYAFNYEGNKGFSIVSADQRLAPVLAYSDNGSFSLENYQQNPGLMIWLESLTDHITEIRDNSGYRENYLYEREHRAHTKREEAYSLEDKNARKGTTTDEEDDNRVQVGPITNILPGGEDIPPPPPDNFVTSRAITSSRLWGQGCGYNDFSPKIARSDRCDRAPAGCGPVAVAMVMWHHRNRISLTHNGVPVNFNNMGNWYPVPGTFGQSPDVARLMGFIGSQIIIDYAANYAMALPKKIPELFNFIGFSSSISDLNHDVVVNEIKAGRPVIFKARTPGVLGISFNHHIWVCEGYRVNLGGRPKGSEYYRMNWGWYGRDNGWFHINDWTPRDKHYTEDRKMITVR